MSDELAVIETEQPTALAPRTYADLELSVLQSYLTQWQQGGSTVTTFSARGIFHIAEELNLSIVDSTFRETSDGKGYTFSATAENLNTGRKFGYVPRLRGIYPHRPCVPAQHDAQRRQGSPLCRCPGEGRDTC